MQLLAMAMARNLPYSKPSGGQVLSADRGAVAREVAALHLGEGDGLYLLVVFDEKFNELVVAHVPEFQTFLVEQRRDSYSSFPRRSVVVDQKVDEITSLGHDFGPLTSTLYQVSRRATLSPQRHNASSQPNRGGVEGAPVWPNR
jgi:hypothetical protein